MNGKIAAALVVLGGLWGPVALAQSTSVPQQLTYEGRLIQADGTPENGTPGFTFAIFKNSGGTGTPAWSVTLASVAVVDGLYSVTLDGSVGGGNAFPVDLFLGESLWLQVSVTTASGTDILSPLQPINSVAYALAAGSLQGGVIDVASGNHVSVNGVAVIDSSGNWVGGSNGGSSGGTGTAGPSGPSGPAGPAGPSGPAGPAGQNGQNGQTGAAGPSGPAGAAGGSGPAGPAGSAGPSGPAGANGTNLPPGTGRNLILFSKDVTQWANVAGDAATITLNTSDSLLGGSSFDILDTAGTSQGSWSTFGPMIPVDPNRYYHGRVSAKLTSGAGTFYAGYVAYNSTGATLAGNGGTFGYPIANGVTLTNNSWLTFEGTIHGAGTNLSNFPAGTRFIRPLVITNYQNIGNTRIDSFEIYEQTVPAYIQLYMTTEVGSPANNSVIPFSGVRQSNLLTSSSNGINLIGGQTYRLEAVVNLTTQGGDDYLGYQFYDTTAGAYIGDDCYSGIPAGASTNYSFHAQCLFIYTPPANTTIQVRVIDSGAGGFNAYPAWGDYFIATELNGG